jgi:pyruvate dehydrogenase E2 component (dihydrolipoamide acetyltransferase)
MTYLSLSFDHRVLDGAMAAEFVNVIKECLEDPKLLLFETD